MKTLFSLLVAFALCGCARFSTKQTDVSYDNGNTNNPSREITTKAAAWTFFSGKSALTNWKATQTDKTQGATVGSLVQEGGQTNQVSDIVAAAVGAAVKATMKP